MPETGWHYCWDSDLHGPWLRNEEEAEKAAKGYFSDTILQKGENGKKMTHSHIHLLNQSEVQSLYSQKRLYIMHKVTHKELYSSAKRITNSLF